MHHFITGVAGFIGSHLADRLLARGDSVYGVDDLSLGRLDNLRAAMASNRFSFEQGDVSQTEIALGALSNASQTTSPPDLIWHLAANSDISAGVADASVDFKRTLTTTYAVLEAARATQVKRIAFASTSAVYGEREGLLTEDAGPLLPISNYGATKLASEALLSAAAESFLDRIWIFRFPNVVGARATHGVIPDLLARLAERPSALKVLGDGTQTKPYLHVSELVEAMLFIAGHANARRNVFNIGPQGDGVSVATLVAKLIERAAPGTPIAYTGGDRGWIGDVPFFRYSTERLRALGWEQSLNSEAAVVRAIDELATAAGR